MISSRVSLYIMPIFCGAPPPHPCQRGIAPLETQNIAFIICLLQRRIEKLRPITAVSRAYAVISHAEIFKVGIQDIIAVTLAVHPRVHDRARSSLPRRDVFRGIAVVEAVFFQYRKAACSVGTRMTVRNSIFPRTRNGKPRQFVKLLKRGKSIICPYIVYKSEDLVTIRLLAGSLCALVVRTDYLGLCLNGRARTAR